MQTARQQEAESIRAQGRKQAQIIRAEADAEASRVYAQSFGKDAAFAAFYRSMQAYEASLGQGDTTMVLSPDSAFFKYFDRGPNAR